VIRPEQLAEALDRIHPRDRELLSLSLRRRVPDEALGRLYECEPTDVARRRARAIEKLADELELQRGEDLGAVLKALLEPETWSAVAATVGEEFAVSAGGGRLTPVPPPDDAEIKASGPALKPVPAQAEEETAEAETEEETSAPADASGNGAPAVEAVPAPPAPAPEAAPPEAAPPEAEPAGPAPAGGEAPTPPTPSEPVLEMLAAREREVPDPPRRAVPVALFGLGIASLVGAAGVVGATQFGDTSTRIVQSDGGGGDDNTRHFIPDKGGPLAAPFPTDPQTVSCYSTAGVAGPIVLRREPGGAKRVRITPRTEWGSPRVLGVVEQRGEWLGVQAPELKNGEIAWMRRDQARTDCVNWSVHADLSKRRMVVRKDGKTVRKMSIAIGRAANPTPKGRFSVTDKLRVTDSSSPYGCCLLALTGHQTRLPDYWPGGDRLAVHATSDESSIGRPVSLGCMRISSGTARWLIRTIPLGAPVFIRA